MEKSSEEEIAVKSHSHFNSLPAGVIKAEPSRLSPKDVIFLETASSGSLVRSLILQIKAPWFEISNDLCPDPYWVRLFKPLWALKLTPWATRPKPSKVGPEPFRPGKVLHPEMGEEPFDLSKYWNWTFDDTRFANEYYTVEEREWRELKSRYWKNKKTKQPSKKRTLHREWYALLGIEAGVTMGDLKKAYRKNAFKYHPDRCKDTNAEEMFMKVSLAYENLVKLFSQKR